MLPITCHIDTPPRKLTSSGLTFCTISHQPPGLYPAFPGTNLNVCLGCSFPSPCPRPGSPSPLFLIHFPPYFLWVPSLQPFSQPDLPCSSHLELKTPQFNTISFSCFIIIIICKAFPLYDIAVFFLIYLFMSVFPSVLETAP